MPEDNSPFEVNLNLFLRAQITRVEQRVYPMRFPVNPAKDGDNIKPLITYQTISAPRMLVHSGPSKATIRRIQIDCWAATYSEAKYLAVEVISHLHGFSGLMHATAVGKSQLENESDAYDPDTGIYHVPLDFEAGHN